MRSPPSYGPSSTVQSNALSAPGCAPCPQECCWEVGGQSPYCRPPWLPHRWSGRSHIAHCPAAFFPCSPFQSQRRQGQLCLMVKTMNCHWNTKRQGTRHGGCRRVPGSSHFYSFLTEQKTSLTALAISGTWMAQPHVHSHYPVVENDCVAYDRATFTTSSDSSALVCMQKVLKLVRAWSCSSLTLPPWKSLKYPAMCLSSQPQRHHVFVQADCHNWKSTVLN